MITWANTKQRAQASNPNTLNTQRTALVLHILRIRGETSSERTSSREKNAIFFCRSTTSTRGRQSNPIVDTALIFLETFLLQGCVGIRYLYWRLSNSIRPFGLLPPYAWSRKTRGCPHVRTGHEFSQKSTSSVPKPPQEHTLSE